METKQIVFGGVTLYVVNNKVTIAKNNNNGRFIKKALADMLYNQYLYFVGLMQADKQRLQNKNNLFLSEIIATSLFYTCIMLAIVVSLFPVLYHVFNF